eukprot:Em0003g18a
MFVVLVDAHSKWLEVSIIPSTSSTNTIRFLRSTFATHGLPELLVSDNGSAFTNQEFKTFVSRNRFRHARCAAYHPSSNGLAERAVQTFKDALKTSGDIATRLARFLFQYQNTPHTTTGRSPAELLLGRKPRTPLDLLHPGNSPTEPQSTETPQEVRATVAKNQQQQKVSHDKRAKQRLFHVGQSVYVTNFRETPNWLPGVITAILAPLTFEVNPCGRQKYRNGGARTPREEGVSDQLETPSRGRGEVGVANTGEELPMEPAEGMVHQGSEPLQLAHSNAQDSSVSGEATSETTEQATAEIAKPQQEVYSKVEEIKRLQRDAYNFQPVLELQNYFTQYRLTPDDELHSLSHELEPKMMVHRRATRSRSSTNLSSTTPNFSFFKPNSKHLSTTTLRM